MQGAHAAYIDHYHSRVAEHLPGLELGWLNRRRRDALARFAAGGFPTLRQEEWRYTNVAPIERRLFDLVPAEPGRLTPADIAPWRIEGTDCLVFVDGWFDHALSRLPEAVGAALIGPLSAVLGSDPEWVERHLGKALTHEEHGFLHFNTAWFSDGAVLRVPAGANLERPLLLLFISSRPDAVATTRNLVVVEQNATAEVIETHVGMAGGNTLGASVSEVVVGEGASLAWTKLQNEHARAYHFGGFYAEQRPASVLRHRHYAFGGLLARSEVHTRLARAATAHLDGLYVGAGRQHLDSHTRIDHLEPDTTSRERYKGIVDQRARGVFQGRIVVHPDAQRSDAEMNNRNLVLSDEAEADTKPQLEIHADDVKCAHGVAIGQLDERAVFYLCSRGVDQVAARNLLTFAFANEMVEKIERPALRQAVLELLLERFPQANVEKDWL